MRSLIERKSWLLLAALLTAISPMISIAKACDDCGNEDELQSALLWNLLHDSENIYHTSGSNNAQGFDHLTVEWATLNSDILDPIEVLHSIDLSPDQTVVFGGSQQGADNSHSNSPSHAPHCELGTTNQFTTPCFLLRDQLTGQIHCT